MTEIVAVVPVREGSQRVKGKNFRPFGPYQSLLHLKLKHLKDANCFDRIFVSSDSPNAAQIAEENGVEFLDRSAELCSSEIRWAPVIAGVAATIPGDPLVAWCHTTSPLFQRYADALRIFMENSDRYDSLVAVRRFNEFVLNAKGRPINYTFGHWHDYSQDLDELYTVTGALFIARKIDIINWHYLIGVNPLMFETTKQEAIDVDDIEDFELAANLVVSEFHGNENSQ